MLAGSSFTSSQLCRSLVSVRLVTLRNLEICACCVYVRVRVCLSVHVYVCLFVCVWGGEGEEAVNHI